MLKSMTGFGRCEMEDANRKITVEIKSVNHRYFDVSFRMPKNFFAFESQMRGLLQEYCSRGKLDVYISYADLSGNSIRLNYNEALAQQYVNCLGEMSERFGIANDLTVTQLAKYPDILTLEEMEEDTQELWEFVETAVRRAAEQFSQSRIREGESLLEDMLAKLEDMSGMVSFIEDKSPQIVEEYRQKLTEKVQAFLEDSSIDESRILAEVTVFADKCCVDEELVRLRSHVDAVRNALIHGGTVGRNMDFIIQEMNREANTILSKTTDLEISNQGIALKTVIEKLREQIQNIE